MEKLRTGEKIAGASGVALLLIMFIFDWFSFGDGAVSEGGNAWQVFGFIDIVLFVAALAAIALVVVSLTESRVDMPVALSAITAGLGVLAVLLILFRIISPPDFGLGDIADAFGQDFDVGRSIGVFLGLIAAAGVAYGGWQAMQDEGTSFSDQADRVQRQRDGDDAPPPPPPPPTTGGTPSAGGPPPGGPAA